MIKNLLFDLGDVLLHIDKKVVPEQFKQWIDPKYREEAEILCMHYEIGKVSDHHFLTQLQTFTEKIPLESLKRCWNATILNFPEKHLNFLERLSDEHRFEMILLSNTNALHIQRVRETMGPERYAQFYNSFDTVYYSHELGMRKPDPAIFRFILDKHGWEPSETLFIDDTEEHIQSAERLGIRTWQLDKSKESVLMLKTRL